jgi:hypothetical protein
MSKARAAGAAAAATGAPRTPATTAAAAAVAVLVPGPKGEDVRRAVDGDRQEGLQPPDNRLLRVDLQQPRETKGPGRAYHPDRSREIAIEIVDHFAERLVTVDEVAPPPRKSGFGIDVRYGRDVGPDAVLELVARLEQHRLAPLRGVGRAHAHQAPAHRHPEPAAVVQHVELGADHPHAAIAGDDQERARLVLGDLEGGLAFAQLHPARVAGERHRELGGAVELDAAAVVELQLAGLALGGLIDRGRDRRRLEPDEHGDS